MSSNLVNWAEPLTVTNCRQRLTKKKSPHFFKFYKSETKALMALGIDFSSFITTQFPFHKDIAFCPKKDERENWGK